MPRPPLQITSGASIPRKPRFTMKDMPQGSEVHEPGSKHYRGGRRGSTLSDEDRGILRGAATRTNETNARSTRLRGRPNDWQVLGGTALGLSAALPVGAGALVPIANRNNRNNAAKLRRKTELGKAWPRPKASWARGPHSVDDDGLMRTAARTKDGAHTVTSMGDHTMWNPTRRAKVRSAAGRLAERVGRDESTLITSGLFAGGTLAGAGVLSAGTRGSRNDLKAATRDRNRTLRQRRKATLVPVDKRGPKPSALKEHFGTPRKAVATLGRNPEHLAAGGVLGAGVGAQAAPLERRRSQSQKERADRASAAVAGAAAGYAAHQGTGYTIRHMGHNRERQRPEGMSRSQHQKIMANHARATGVRQNTKPNRAQAPTFYRTYPEGLPATKYKRALGHMSGKKGAAIQAGFMGTGMVAAHQGVGRRQKAVSKALYQREDRLNPVRTLQLAGGLTLAAYGLGHSGMVGRALGRGVKVAQRRGNDQVAEALARANAARGSIRAGMAPGEAAVRRIKAVDSAVRKVPRPLRGEVALVAGAMMGTQAMPVRRTHYRPVSAPVPTYRRSW